jgi:plasmid stability protein
MASLSAAYRSHWSHRSHWSLTPPRQCYHLDSMAKSILIRDVDEELVVRLKARAERSGRSLQAELKLIIENAAEQDEARQRMIDQADAFHARLLKRNNGKLFPDSSKLIRRDRESR